MIIPEGAVESVGAAPCSMVGLFADLPDKVIAALARRATATAALVVVAAVGTTRVSVAIAEEAPTIGTVVTRAAAPSTGGASRVAAVVPFGSEVGEVGTASVLRLDANLCHEQMGEQVTEGYGLVGAGGDGRGKWIIIRVQVGEDVEDDVVFVHTLAGCRYLISKSFHLSEISSSREITSTCDAELRPELDDLCVRLQRKHLLDGYPDAGGGVNIHYLKENVP